MTLKNDAKFEENASHGKFEEKLTCGLETPEHLKVSKLVLSWDPLV